MSEYSLTYPGTVSPRAPALPPDDRRAAIVSATLPLLHHHGRAVTTRQIAEAAGVAEGTLFKVFATKDAIIDAAIEHAFEPSTFVAHLEEIDPTLPLRDRLVAVTALMQVRFIQSFGLIRALGLLGPPASLQDDEQRRYAWRAQVGGAIAAVVEPDASQLRVPASELVGVLRLLTFAGSHHEVADGQLMSAEQIVDTLLYGLLADRVGSDD